MAKDNKKKSRKILDPFGGFIPKKRTGKKKKFSFYWMYLLIFLVFLGLNYFSGNNASEELNWGEFETNILSENDLDKVIVVNGDFAEIFIKLEKLNKPYYDDVRNTLMNGNINKGPHFIINIGSIEIFDTKMSAYYEKNPHIERTFIQYQTRKSWASDIFSWLFFIIAILIIWMLLFRRMGGGASQIFNIGKSKARLSDANTKVKVNFSHVAGQDGAKEELKEIVDFLKKPEKYTKLGGKIPKGALLIGPPGTGKTLLAKAVSGEANVPFFSLSGSDFVEMFVGVGAARVRDLFTQAKNKKPCIVFIDELDAVGRARGKTPGFASNDERENTLNQLLTEMDGFSENSGIIMLAATNRAEILDRALLRPGRFDRQIQVDFPDLKERKAIFQVHTQTVKIDKNVDLEFFAKQTSGFSGADIANVCNEAALIAARKSKKKVQRDDFLDAIDRIIGGLEKKDKIITPQEKKVVAVHESGHATASWFLKHADSLVKVSIVPRGQSLGAAWYLPEERQITTTSQLLDQVCTALGGRVAEQLILGEISTGALNDLSKITKIAYNMVANFGLNDKIGNVSFFDFGQENETLMQKPYSEKTAESIDNEVRLLIQEAYKKTEKILTDNKDKVIRLSEILLEKEVIYKEDLEKLFGEKQLNELEETPPQKSRKKTSMKSTPKKTSQKVEKTTRTTTKTKSTKNTVLPK